MSNHNTSSFCLPSSSSWAQSWESSCSQEGEMGHILLICLCNLSVHHRHLKWVRCSRGILLQHRRVCYTPRRWAGSGLTDAPSLGKIKKKCIDLIRTWSPLVGFWKGDRQSLTERDTWMHKRMRYLSWSRSITVEHARKLDCYNWIQRIQMMSCISTTTGQADHYHTTDQRLILGLKPKKKKKAWEITKV